MYKKTQLTCFLHSCILGPIVTQLFQTQVLNLPSYTLILTQDRISIHTLILPPNLPPSIFAQVKPKDKKIQEMPKFSRISKIFKSISIKSRLPWSIEKFTKKALLNLENKLRNDVEILVIKSFPKPFSKAKKTPFWKPPFWKFF